LALRYVFGVTCTYMDGTKIEIALEIRLKVSSNLGKLLLKVHEAVTLQKSFTGLLVIDFLMLSNINAD